MPTQTHDRHGPKDAQPLDAGLYVVATPIGNLRDITLRALDVLAGVDLVLAEDTRTTRTLLDAYSLRPTLRTYHEHNAARERPGILAALRDGGRVALVSDAGTPLISDPGYKLVRDALGAGIRVIPIPGASAVMAGLVAAGLATDQFHFAGFLPAKAAARTAALAGLAPIAATLVFFETGPRAGAALTAMAAMLGEREAVIARELTKKFEETKRGTLLSLAEEARETPPRGELVILVAGAPASTAWSDAHVDAALAEALSGGASVKDAAAQVAVASGWARRDVYARALALRQVPEA